MSRRSIIRRTLACPVVAVAVGVALAVAGCGATAPQAPFAQAKKLDSATGDISTDCGLSYQVTAFPGNHRADIASLEASATSSARKLASVYARNPAWIYQGDTVAPDRHDGVADASRLRATRRGERAQRSGVSSNLSAQLGDRLEHGGGAGLLELGDREPAGEHRERRHARTAGGLDVPGGVADHHGVVW